MPSFTVAASPGFSFHMSWRLFGPKQDNERGLFHCLDLRIGRLSLLVECWPDRFPYKVERDAHGELIVEYRRFRAMLSKGEPFQVHSH